MNYHSSSSMSLCNQWCHSRRLNSKTACLICLSIFCVMGGVISLLVEHSRTPVVYTVIMWFTAAAIFGLAGIKKCCSHAPAIDETPQHWFDLFLLRHFCFSEDEWIKRLSQCCINFLHHPVVRESEVWIHMSKEGCWRGSILWRVRVDKHLSTWQKNN